MDACQNLLCALSLYAVALKKKASGGCCFFSPKGWPSHFSGLTPEFKGTAAQIELARLSKLQPSYQEALNFATMVACAPVMNTNYRTKEA